MRKGHFWLLLTAVVSYLIMGHHSKFANNETSNSRNVHFAKIIEYRYGPFLILPYGIDSTSKSPRIDSIICEYDRLGRIIDSSAYDNRTLYKYDGNGNMIEKIFKGSLGDVIYNTKWILDYNIKNQLLSQTQIVNNENVYMTTYFYNDNGFLIKEITSPLKNNSSNRTKDTCTYEYNNKVKIRHSNIRGNYKFLYDDYGNIIKKVYYGKIDTSIYNYRYIYDSSGNLSVEILYNDKDKILHKDSLSYDIKGKLVNEKMSRGSRTETTKFSEGLTREVTFIADNKITYQSKYFYEYY